ncbi:Hypothetical_protein [Hexamita inflata]|uniref:Hypothetical_protein n=1 Tax=Hexamita inflata TaxID=28002 RepID=A0AA86QXG0_9EUKA|nr:Hypothetical protein HINF_LOCUS46945 [Hexamita inflata]
MKQIGKRIILDIASSALGGKQQGCGTSCASCPSAGSCHGGIGSLVKNVQLTDNQENDDQIKVNTIVKDDVISLAQQPQDQQPMNVTKQFKDNETKENSFSTQTSKRNKNNEQKIKKWSDLHRDVAKLALTVV